MRRREFITLIGGAVAFAPLPARAQDWDRTYRIGFLLSAPRQSLTVVALFDELRRNGLIEGQT
jgi:hypothetical protein